MYIAKSSPVPLCWRNWSVLFLAFSWCVGLSFGVYYAAAADVSLFSLMRRTFLEPVSIVSSISIMLLPFLFTIVAVYLRDLRLFLFPCAVKGFLFSFTSQCFAMSFGYSSGMIRLLYFFAEHVSVVTLIWFWIRHIPGFRCSIWRDIIFSTVFVLGITLLANFLISPILAAIVIV